MHPLLSLVLLVLLGLTTYLIVQRVSSYTRTPTWLLWLVAMMPALIWSGWALTQGNQKPPPSYLVVVPLLVCLLLYWFLIQWGRVSPPAASSTAARDQNSPSSRVVEPTHNESPVLRPIDKAEEQHLQSCFPWSIYYLQNVEYRPQAVICRGQLRSRPEVAYKTIRENVEGRFGDRFLVVFQEDQTGKPFFALVSNPYAKQLVERERSQITRPTLAISLLVATFCTTTLAWLQIAGKFGSSGQPAQLSPDLLVQGLPYALALLLILGCHELAHYLTARRYNIRATLPYFIPILPLPWFPFGTFGAFIQIRSPIPNRRALFDIGISGPLAGFFVALPLLLWGLAHSEVVSMPDKPELFNFLAFDPKFSLLLTLLSKSVLGSVLTAETAIKMHPVAVASSLGLIVTAFNLMPVGQLDGGHILHAMVGQRAGSFMGQIARLLLLLLSFTQLHLMPWAILLFLMPANDEPTLNDVTELDNRRDLWGVLSLALLLLIILPAPGVVTRLLNI
ncbi:MAG: site-2 protease family protein [Leptolyngbyaceae cyanobacterium RU_5_1]|nr:site-2 protease family protein [Leptolyngbyaceae cyanobacterium RU_5_1]